jgi:putative addiction module antidote
MEAGFYRGAEKKARNFVSIHREFRAPAGSGERLTVSAGAATRQVDRRKCAPCRFGQGLLYKQYNIYLETTGIAMIRPLKIRKWGGSYGVTLPKRLLDALGVGEGDVLYPVRTPNGVELTPYDPDFEQALEASREFMRRYPNAMKKLAKG